MCKGTDCLLKHYCYRFRAVPENYQPYFITPPYDKEKGSCDKYWPIDESQ